MPNHPDRERLAAFQAGDGDRRQRAEVEAHLAGCPSCAEVVASVEQARRRLALLEEPALPPGFHDRLAAAVEAEAAQPAANGPAPWYRRRAAQRPHPRPTPEQPHAHPAPEQPDARPTRERPHARPVPWYRRPVAWGAAAALLLAALIVPFLDWSSGNHTTAGGAADADRLPVIRVPGEVSAATVRSRLVADSRAKAALDAAADAPGAQAATPRAGQGAEPSAQSPDQAPGYRSTAPQAGTANLQPCLPAAAAVADRATRPLRPAFFVQGDYRGRQATILVTISAGQPGRVDLWVFPRDNCSSRPLATEQVR